MFEYTCPCKGSFCIKCRVPELHNCTFDFKLENQLRLTKDNPVIVGEKVGKI
jgi:predicted nucleic acid binding AN1-type Zn finger protein